MERAIATYAKNYGRLTMEQNRKIREKYGDQVPAGLTATNIHECLTGDCHSRSTQEVRENAG